MSNLGETLVFWICGGLAVFGALGMIISRKAVHSALFIAMTMINLAVLYIANSAPFLGMVQIIVYTGAVMMLFLFVLMVVGVDSSDSLIETIRGQRAAAILFGLALGVLLIAILGTAMTGMIDNGLEQANSEFGGNVEGLAHSIFDGYLLAFEATAALLITAALGAMVLTHRDLWKPRKTQRELSEERFMVGAGHPGNKPNPGIYARHNAVNTPAILPDGSLALDSVPASVRSRDDSMLVDHRDVTEILEVTELGGSEFGSSEGDSR